MRGLGVVVNAQRYLPYLNFLGEIAYQGPAQHAQDQPTDKTEQEGSFSSCFFLQ